MGLLDYADAARNKLREVIGDMPLAQIIRGEATMPTRNELAARLRAMPVFENTPEANQGALDVAMNFGPGILGTFAGAGAKTANKAALEMAEALERGGADRAKIWNETGWFKGPDGKWRFEIDDSAAAFRDYNFTPRDAYRNARENALIDNAGLDRVRAMEPYAARSRNQLREEFKTTGDAIVAAAVGGDKALAKKLSRDRAGLTDMFDAMRNRKYGPMATFLKHKELGAAYPDVYNVHTRISPDDLGGGAGASYHRAQPGTAEQIVLSSKPRWTDDKGTVLHELQHAIQSREGFARGGSPREIGGYRDPIWEAHINRKLAPLLERNREITNAFQAGRERLEGARALIESDPKWARAKTEKAQQKIVDKYLPGFDVKSHYDLRRQGADLKAAHRRIIEEAGFGPSQQERIDLYNRLAGEAEARAVQARMDMTPAQRKATPPWQSYDVPWEELITIPQK